MAVRERNLFCAVKVEEVDQVDRMLIMNREIPNDCLDRIGASLRFRECDREKAMQVGTVELLCEGQRV